MRGNQVEVRCINTRRMAQLAHLATHKEIERLDLLRVFFSFVSLIACNIAGLLTDIRPTAGVCSNGNR